MKKDGVCKTVASSIPTRKTKLFPFLRSGTKTSVAFMSANQHAIIFQKYMARVEQSVTLQRSFLAKQIQATIVQN